MPINKDKEQLLLLKGESMFEVLKKIWVLYPGDTGGEVFGTEKEAKKAKRYWKKEDLMFGVTSDVVRGPFEYILKENDK